MSYYVEIAEDPANFSVLSGSAVVPSSELQIVYSNIFSNLTKGRQYYGRVLAITSLGSGSFSSASSGSYAVDVPTSPLIVKANSGNVAGSNFLTLFWTPPSDTGLGVDGSIPIVSYSVEISDASNFSSLVISQNAPPSARSLTLQSSQLVKGVTYFLRLGASNAVGLGPNSDAFTRLLVTAPSPPTAVVLLVTGPLELSLTWKPPTDTGAGSGVEYPLLSYSVRVYMASSSYDFQVAALNTSTNITYFQGSRLLKGSTYYAAVSAVNDAVGGISSTSQSPPKTVIDLSGQPSSTQLCSFDAWFYPAAGACKETGPLSLLLAWGKPSDSGAGEGIVTAETAVLAYEVSFSNDAFFANNVSTFSVQAVSDQSNLFYTFSGLLRDVMYWARIRAITSIGSGSYRVSDGRSSVDIPGPPKLLTVQSKTASTNGESYISVSWSIPKDLGSDNSSCLILSYTLTVSNLSSFPVFSSNTFTETATMLQLPLQVGVPVAQREVVQYATSRSVQKGLAFFLRVRATNGVGAGQNSNVMQVLITGYPGQPHHATITVSGPLALLVAWSRPADLGAGVDVPYDNIVYEYLTWSWLLGSKSTSFPTLGNWKQVPGGSNVTSFRFSNLTKGLVYKVAVRAVNLASGDPSLQSTGTGGGLWKEDDTDGVTVLALPSPPSNFTLRPSGNLSLLGQWNPPADSGSGTSAIDFLAENGYELQICRTGECNEAVVSVVSRSKVEFPIQFMLGSLILSVGSSVSARIRAVNPAGVSQWSAYIESSVLSLPGTPSNVTVSLGGEALGFVMIYVYCRTPLETGLGPQSKQELLTSIQIQAVPDSSSLVSCVLPQPVSVFPQEKLDVTAAVPGLSKVCIFVFMSPPLPLN